MSGIGFSNGAKTLLGREYNTMALEICSTEGMEDFVKLYAHEKNVDWSCQKLRKGVRVRDWIHIDTTLLSMDIIIKFIRKLREKYPMFLIGYFKLGDMCAMILDTTDENEMDRAPEWTPKEHWKSLPEFKIKSIHSH